MAERLAIDFGAATTLVARWDEGAGRAASEPLPGLSRPLAAPEGEEPWWSGPSLIHFGQSDTRWLGQQVVERDLYDSPRTFRWMKRFVATRNPARLLLDGRAITCQEAARQFLSAILGYLALEEASRDAELALTIPVEAYEHYEDWLLQIAEAAGFRRLRVIDEPSAAALGHGLHIQPGDVYLVFDMGASTVNVSVVLLEERGGRSADQRCRVLGKAGADLGGMVVDRWLYQEALRRNGLGDSDEMARRVSRPLLARCEWLKERLSFVDRDGFVLADPATGRELVFNCQRRELEALLEAEGLPGQLDRVIRRALREAWEKGYAEEQVKDVLMVGGGSLMPCIQDGLRRFFGSDRVQVDRPLVAVALGAAAFAAGVAFFDHIQHQYAIRFVDPASGGYRYQPIVERGTPYPTPAPVARLTIKASHHGQRQLGLAIFEVSRQQAVEKPVELVFDPSGAVRIVALGPAETERQQYFWMNEGNPLFLEADPPAAKSEPRFEITFGVDANKRLLLTVWDIVQRRHLLADHPVVKLS